MKKIFLLLITSIFLISIASATTINSCQWITTSGNYELTSDIGNGCIFQIRTSNDISLDCKNHIISGNQFLVGDSEPSILSNITIKNCVFDNIMVDFNHVKKSKFINNTIRNSYVGLKLRDSFEINVSKNVFEYNNYGIQFSSPWEGTDYLGFTPINNIIYDNTFFNSINIIGGNNNFTFLENHHFNYWNTTIGNYWGTIDGTGFSQMCVDSNKDGLCDSNYDMNYSNIDYKSLKDQQPPLLNSSITNGTYLSTLNLEINAFDVRGIKELYYVLDNATYNYTNIVNLDLNVGNHSLLVHAKDLDNLVTELDYNFEIYNDIPNILSITNTNILDIYELEDYNFSVEVNDSDVLNYSWFMNGIDLNNIKNYYEYHSDIGSEGSYNLSVIIDDGINQTIYEWNFNVLNVAPNIVNSTSSMSDVNESLIKDFFVTVEDIDSLTYVWKLNNDILNETSNRLNFNSNTEGNYNLTVYIDDGIDVVSKNWNFNILNVLPNITSYGPLNISDVYELDNIIFNITAEDVDDLSYSWVLNGMILNDTNTIYNYTSQIGSEGNYELIVYIDDGYDVVSKKWNFVVKNVAPKIDFYTPALLEELEETFSVIFNVSVIDVDNLSYSWILNNVTLNASDNNYRFDTDYNSEGTYNMTFIVFDGIDTDTKEWLFNVTNKIPPSTGGGGGSSSDPNVINDTDDDNNNETLVVICHKERKNDHHGMHNEDKDEKHMQHDYENEFHEIIVEEKDVQSHLNHGDYRGYCEEEKEDDHEMKEIKAKPHEDKNKDDDSKISKSTRERIIKQIKFNGHDIITLPKNIIYQFKDDVLTLYDFIKNLFKRG